MHYNNSRFTNLSISRASLKLDGVPTDKEVECDFSERGDSTVATLPFKMSTIFAWNTEDLPGSQVPINHNVGISLSFKMSSPTASVHTALVIRQTKRLLGINVAGRVLKERWRPDIFETCRPVEIHVFSGAYAKDTFIQTFKQEKIYVVNNDPSWAPGRHWFVVDHTGPLCHFRRLWLSEPLVCLRVLARKRWCSIFFQQCFAKINNNCGGDYCYFYVYLCARVNLLVMFFTEQGGRERPWEGPLCCVRCVCKLLELLIITEFMYLVFLTKCVRLLTHLD